MKNYTKPNLKMTVDYLFVDYEKNERTILYDYFIDKYDINKSPSYNICEIISKAPMDILDLLIKHDCSSIRMVVLEKDNPTHFKTVLENDMSCITIDYVLSKKTTSEDKIIETYNRIFSKLLKEYNNIDNSFLSSFAPFGKLFSQYNIDHINKQLVNIYINRPNTRYMVIQSIVSLDNINMIDHILSSSPEKEIFEIIAKHSSEKILNIIFDRIRTTHVIDILVQRYDITTIHDRIVSSSNCGAYGKISILIKYGLEKHFEEYLKDIPERFYLYELIKSENISMNNFMMSVECYRKNYERDDAMEMIIEKQISRLNLKLISDSLE